jgi:uridylate kinase
MPDMPEDQIKKIANETITTRLRNIGIVESDDIGVIRTRANNEFVQSLRDKIGMEKLQSVIEFVEEMIKRKEQRNKTFTDIFVTAIGNSLPVLIPLLVSAAFTYWIVKK